MHARRRQPLRSADRGRQRRNERVLRLFAAAAGGPFPAARRNRTVDCVRALIHAVLTPLGRTVDGRPGDDSRRRAQGKAGAVESAVQSLEGQRQRATASTSGLARVATRPAASGLAKKSAKSASPVPGCNGSAAVICWDASGNLSAT